jgi:hypothetical protein
MRAADSAKFKSQLRRSAVLGFVLVTRSATAQLLRPTAMDDVAERDVKLVLALGQHDSDYVDAYYGPPEWRAEAERARLPLAQIRGEVERLLRAVPEPAEVERADELLRLRHQYLRRQLEAVLARVRLPSGTTFPFDEESLALYDAVAPTHPEAYFQPILEEVEARCRKLIVSKKRLDG